jgi:hypothetical protein
MSPPLPPPPPPPAPWAQEKFALLTESVKDRRETRIGFTNLFDAHKWKNLQIFFENRWNLAGNGTHAKSLARGSNPLPQAIVYKSGKSCGCDGRHDGRPMTPLRAKYVRDLAIRGRAERTQEAYTRYACDLARYYRRSPPVLPSETVK